MKTVTIDTDPRPVESVVTAEGGMERADRSTYMGVNLAALAQLQQSAPAYVWGAGTGGPHYSAGGGSISAPKMDAAFTGKLVNAAESSLQFERLAFDFRAVCPPIVSPGRCRSVLLPVEGI